MSYVLTLCAIYRTLDVQGKHLTKRKTCFAFNPFFTFLKNIIKTDKEYNRETHCLFMHGWKIVFMLIFGCMKYVLG
jgi:hypothetical protein